MIKYLIVFLLLVGNVPAVLAARYLSQDEFLQQAFAGGEYVQHKMWVTEEVKAAAKSILKHDYNRLRIRYWGVGNKTAWIIDEIGKERPITIGVVVDKKAIHQVSILEFRESRGWEVRHDFFTKQFVGASLTDKQKLSNTIDGISGATLSVSAVKKVAAFSLYLHGLTPFSDS